MGKDCMISIVLVDDQASVRYGLRMRLLLEPDITVVGEASNGKEALTLVPKLCPDVVLMDIEMPDMDGITTTATLHAMFPQCAIVMLSIYDDRMTRTRAQMAGAIAFIEKRGSTEELLSTIRRAVQPTS